MALFRRHFVSFAALLAFGAFGALGAGLLGRSVVSSSEDSSDDTSGRTAPALPEENPWTIVKVLNPDYDPEGPYGFASVTGYDGIPQWEQVTVDLTGYESTRIRIRFRFHSVDDNYNDYEGWWLRDIRLDGQEITDWTVDGRFDFPGWQWEITHWRYYDPAYGHYVAGQWPFTTYSWGTLTSPVLATDADPVLTFWTKWEIEGYQPSGFDLMEVYVEEVPVTLAFEYLDELGEWTPTTGVVMLAAVGDEIGVRVEATVMGEPLKEEGTGVLFTSGAPALVALDGKAGKEKPSMIAALDSETGVSEPVTLRVQAGQAAAADVTAALWDFGKGTTVSPPAALPVTTAKAEIALEVEPRAVCADKKKKVTLTATVTRPDDATLRPGAPVALAGLEVLFKSGGKTILRFGKKAQKSAKIDAATGKAVVKGKTAGKAGVVTVKAGAHGGTFAADEAECDLFVVEVESISAADTEPPGLSVTDSDSGVEDPVKTLVVCASETGSVKISVTPDPDLAEADLPKTWAITKVGGTLNLLGTPGKLSATVSKAAPGDITVQVKCHPKSKEHFRVRVLVLEIELVTPAGDPVAAPDDSGDGQNEFTFSGASPGVLTMNLKAKVSPGGIAAQIKEQCQFTVGAVGSSTMARDAAHPNGEPTANGDYLEATVTFTGLPAANSDLGTKKAAIYFKGGKRDETTYQVLFPKSKKNHPGAGSGTTPNWYYYWAGTAVTEYDITSGTYGYADGGPGDYAEYNGDPLNPHYTIHGPASAGHEQYNSAGLQVDRKGIDTCTATLVHEKQHRQTDLDWRPGGAWFGKADTDGDELPDDWEDTHAAQGFDKTKASSFTPAFIYGDDEEVWCEMNALGATGEAAKDWANPGKQSKAVF